MWDERLEFVLVDEETEYARELAAHLMRQGLEPRLGRNLEKASRSFLKSGCDILVVVMREPEQCDLSLIRRLGEALPSAWMIFLLAPEMDVYRDMLRQAGAHHVFSLELGPSNLADMLISYVELFHLSHQNRRLRQMLDGRSQYESLIGGSLAMRAMYRLLDQVSSTETSVLINGERGTERVDVARAIHARSQRGGTGLEIVDCRESKDDPDGLAVFGPRGSGRYGKGPTQRGSAFARAGRGTLVLHHVDALHPEAQRRLLAYLHEPFFQNESPSTPQPLARMITTTAPNVLDEVEAGRFERELYYRLNVLQVRVPPLRERREDIPMLTQYYMRNDAEGTAHPAASTGLSFTSRALLTLLQYDWQGEPVGAAPRGARTGGPEQGPQHRPG